MKKQIIMIAFLAMWKFSFSQTITPVVVASQGDFYTSAPGSISWTLGELSTESYSVASNYITQGFQQPKLLLSTGVLNTITSPSNITAYPNPVNDQLVLSFKESNADYTIDVYDVSGKKIHSEHLNTGSALSSEAKLSFAKFESGIYLVTVSDEKGNTKESFKISKIN